MYQIGKYLSRSQTEIGVVCHYKMLFYVRKDFKYYFADFVRKGGTPPPLRTKFSPKKVTDLGGTLPPFTDKIRKVVFDGLPKEGRVGNKLAHL